MRETEDEEITRLLGGDLDCLEATDASVLDEIERRHLSPKADYDFIPASIVLGGAEAIAAGRTEHVAVIARTADPKDVSKAILEVANAVRRRCRNVLVRAPSDQLGPIARAGETAAWLRKNLAGQPEVTRALRLLLPHEEALRWALGHDCSPAAKH